MFPGESAEVPPSFEETDQLHWSIKKFKRGPIDLEEEPSEPMVADEETEDQDNSMEIGWPKMTFAEKLWQKQERPPLYMGEDEIDELDDVGIPFLEELHL